LPADAGTLLGPELADRSGPGSWPTRRALALRARRPDFRLPAGPRGHPFACPVV